jgi:tetratricopeptide (TPR) repeat protein
MDLIQCAKCKKEFEWDKAYYQQDTPGSHMHNPPGHGNFRPRAFCPHCGSLVAEWDIDRYQDKDRWKWYGENVKINSGRELPPSPFTPWGQSISPDARVTVSEDHIDITLVRRLLGEGTSKEVKGEKTEAETLSPAQIFTNANEELNKHKKSRARYFNRKKEAFDTLKSYVEGKGKSDAKAIALLGMIEYFDNKKELARNMFNRAMKLDESCALCHLGFGILDYRGTDTAKPGIEPLNRAIALDPWLVEAYIWKARIQKQKLKDPQGAWDSLQAAITTIGLDNLKEHPLGWDLFEELGEMCVHYNMGELSDAIRYFETALQMNPKDYYPPMYLMYIYGALGQSAEVARTQAAYARVDQGIVLSSDGINTIQKFVSKSLDEAFTQTRNDHVSTVSVSKEQKKRKWWQFWK